MKTIKTSPYIPTTFEVKEIGENRINVMAYPFETGYAITLAHPIRRLLLSSSVGYAIVGLRVEGISHEFDSVRGLLEDISPFIVNLKNLRFAIIDEEAKAAKQIQVDYEFTGPLSLSGASLIKDGLSVINTNAYLATINEDATIRFTIIVQQGIGFVPSEEIRELIPEDFIPLDAYFTPVKRAVYEIENVLVGEDPNYEKIVFDIETDGQIDPLTSFKDSISIMHKQMEVFGIDLTPKGDDSQSLIENEEVKTLLTRIDTLKSELSQRCMNCLQRAGLEYIGELAMMSEGDIKGIKNLGKKVYEEIAEKLQSLGYPVGVELPSDIESALIKQLAKLKNNN